MHHGYLSDASYLESFLLDGSFAGDLTSLPPLCTVPVELEVPDLAIPVSTCLRTSRKGSQRPTPYRRPECSSTPWRQPAYGYPLTLPDAHLHLPATHNTPSSLTDSNQHNSSTFHQQLPAQACDLTPSSASTPEPKKKQYRRKRTVFSPAELQLLNDYYSRNKFLNPDLKTEILAKIEVPGNVLVMWFQNKRAKDRASGIVI